MVDLTAAAWDVLASPVWGKDRAYDFLANPPWGQVDIHGDEVRPDAVARRNADPIDRPPLDQVRERVEKDDLPESDHPSLLRICEDCFEVDGVATRCRWVLCRTCWAKKAREDARDILDVLDALYHRHHGRATDHLRMVTLTIPSGTDLEERADKLDRVWQLFRHRKAWKDRTWGATAKFEVAWDPDAGWHPHLHLLHYGRYLAKEPPDHGPWAGTWPDPFPPSQIQVADCDPDDAALCVHQRALLARSPDRWTVDEEWTDAARSAGLFVPPTGLVTDVRATHGRHGPAKELGKYLAKPTAGAGTADDEDQGEHLRDWPVPVRRELARWMLGGERVRWRCDEHGRHTANGGYEQSRSICQDQPGDCDGGYVKEATGRKRLRWYGDLRDLRQDLDRIAEVECSNCGGRMLSEHQLRRLARRDPDADALLGFIQASKSGDGDDSEPGVSAGQGDRPPPTGGDDDHRDDRPDFLDKRDDPTAIRV